MRYEAHLPALSLRDGEGLCTILEGTVLPMVQGHIICNNWHLCRMCWEDSERKNAHVPTSPGVTSSITGILKTSQGG